MSNNTLENAYISFQQKDNKHYVEYISSTLKATQSLTATVTTTVTKNTLTLDTIPSPMPTFFVLKTDIDITPLDENVLKIGLEEFEFIFKEDLYAISSYVISSNNRTPATYTVANNSRELIELVSSDNEIEPATAIPIKPDDDTGAVGISDKYTREDHKHPQSDVADNYTELATGYTLEGGSSTNKTLTVTEDSTIDQNLSISSDVTHNNIKLTSLTNKALIGTDGIGNIIEGTLDIATDPDIVAKTAGKLLDATRLLDDENMVSNSPVKSTSIRSIVSYVNSKTSGNSMFRGGLVGNADLTGSSTGNTYIDGISEYENGDYFDISSDGDLTVNAGVITVKQGENIKFIKKVTKLLVSTADIYLDKAPTNGTHISNTPYADISATNMQGAVNELQDEKITRVLNSGDIIVGTAGNTAGRVTMTGDVSIDNLGVTTVLSASTTQAGKVELATATETETGTALDRAVTPVGTEATYLKRSTIDTKGDLLVGDIDNHVVKLPIGPNGTVLTPDSTALSGLKWAEPFNGVYKVGVTNLSTTTGEFFEDSRLRLQLSAGLLQLRAVGTALPFSFYLHNMYTLDSSMPPSTLVNLYGSYSSAPTTSWITISNIAISTDYDDCIIGWLETSGSPYKYRITIFGQAIGMSCTVERFDSSKVPNNTKIIFP